MTKTKLLRVVGNKWEAQWEQSTQKPQKKTSQANIVSNHLCKELVDDAIASNQRRNAGC